MIWTLTILLAAASTAVQAPDTTRLLIGSLTLGARDVVFSYSGDLWAVSREGGAARRLTDHPGEDDFPRISRDGQRLAFSRRAGGDWDVYVMASKGGEAPRRLTFNPEMDVVRGWTAGGDTVLFMSHRDEEGTFRLYRVGAEGGFPKALPLRRAYDGSFAATGDLAYVPTALPREILGNQWRYYRGGLVSDVLIGDPAEGTFDRVPGPEANELHPIWVGQRVYFLSDRSGVFNVYVYDRTTGAVEQLTTYEDYGVDALAATGDAIAFVQAGLIRMMDPSTGDVRTLEVQVRPDSAELQPRTVAGADWVQFASVSRSGDEVVLGVRGDVSVVSGSGDSVRTVTSSSASAERYPTISPDGRSIAYFTDESGEYQLTIADRDGETRTIPIELQPTYYREPVWSPDSRKLAFTGKQLSLWVVDLETGGARRVETSSYSNQGEYHPSWSADSRWLAYSKYEESGVRVVYVYDVQRGRKHRVTDGRAHADYPVFDRNGKYLYLVSSNTTGVGEFGWSVLSGRLLRPLVTRTLQVVLLEDRHGLPHLPILGDANTDAQPAAESVEGGVALVGIGSRIAPLPTPERDYAEVSAGAPGVLFVLVSEWPDSRGLFSTPIQSLYRYDLREPDRLEPFVQDIDEYSVSADGSMILYRKDGEWFTVPAEAPPEEGAGQLDLGAVELSVDPRQEWRQIYHEAWRLMRDYFYDPNHHGQDLDELERHYAGYLPGIVRRSDLNELIRKMLGHISVSHLRVRGGDIPPDDTPSDRIGLLGADFEVSSGRYRIKRVYRSGHYSDANPLLRAPLDQPGMTITEGEYLLAVNGQSIDASRNLYSYFEGTAVKPVEIRVGPNPNGTGARTYRVVPVPGENHLRRMNWADRNRRKIETATGGRIGYIYVPNYGSGLEGLFRDLFAYRDRGAIILDQRFNTGGTTSDYVIEWLGRRALYYYAFRDGQDIPVPVNPIRAPTVLLINGFNASAAETFALMYKLGDLGPIIGTRTLGGGIGPYVFVPELVDGGRISIPNRAAYDPAGSWAIENQGVEPDHPVEMSPSDAMADIDQQLQRALDEALRLMREQERHPPKRPPYPVHDGEPTPADTATATEDEGGNER